MKVIVVKDYQAMSDLAAEIIANTIKANPSCTLGLATGSAGSPRHHSGDRQ